jgi:Glycosyl hydrolase family 26
MTGADVRKVSAEKIWSLWYAPFFAFLNKNKHIIRAISYTTCNSNRNVIGVAGAGSGYWGDSRITENPFIKKRWEKEMGRPRNWLQPIDKILDAIILPEPTGRKVLSAKYAPRNPNSSLFCLGQDLEGILDYATNISIGGSPSGVITYTAIQAPPGFAVPGLQSSINCGSGILHAAGLLNVFPKSILVIGLEFVERNSADTIEKLARGELDGQLDELAAFLISADRPVLLRVGYQFDSRWNKYNPTKYKAAFRKIVTHLRHVRHVQNFASVWQSATSALGTHENRPISDWWPGEDVVDWIGGAYFQYHARSWQHLLEFAKQTRKPVIICEAAPHGIDIGRSTIAAPM